MDQLDARHDKPNIPAMAKIPRSIAIVDDDPSVLKALARLVGAHSFATRTYLSAPQFLASLAEGLPDCLIADLQMPEMTGLELQQNLARKGIRIPTIIITAHDEAGMRERCTMAGAIAYLPKPVQDASLFAAIEAAGVGNGP
jgi:FixJ family two-component response regulator